MPLLLSSIGAEIEGKLRETLFHLLCQPDDLKVKVVREHTDYQFTVYVGDRFAATSHSYDFFRNPLEDFDIDDVVEELVLFYNICRFREHRDALERSDLSDQQLIMMALAHLLYQTDDKHGIDSAIAYELCDRINNG